MKKIILILILLTVLTGCVQNDKNEIKNEYKELESKFIYTDAKCLIDGAGIVYASMNRYDEVEIIREDDAYYYINYYGLELAIEKGYIRKENTDKFESYTAYTKSGAKSYKDIFNGTVVDSFQQNDEVKVIDAFLGYVVIEKDGIESYMYASKISKTPIQTKTKKPNPTPTPGNQDGEDIELSTNKKYSIVLLADGFTEKGYILANNVSAYIDIVNRDENVKVLYHDDTISTILVEGRVCTIKNDYIRQENEIEYPAYDGYAKSGAYVYRDFALTSAIRKLSFNEVVKVVEAIEGKLVVEMSDGTIGYMSAGYISNAKNKQSSKPVSPSPKNDDADWTDPAL